MCNANRSGDSTNTLDADAMVRCRGRHSGTPNLSSAEQMLVEATAAPGGVFEGDLETDQDPGRVMCFSLGYWRAGATRVRSAGVARSCSRSVHHIHHPLSIMMTKALQLAFA